MAWPIPHWRTDRVPRDDQLYPWAQREMDIGRGGLVAIFGHLALDKAAKSPRSAHVARKISLASE